MKIKDIKVSLVLADKDEWKDDFELFKNHSINFCGIGKINAASGTTEIICKYAPDLIINLGTAGNVNLKENGLFQCMEFIQRDMDATLFGYKQFQTPYERDELLPFSTKTIITSYPKAICGTGDSVGLTSDLEKNRDNLPYNLMEMEGYAIAKICDKFSTPFISIKAISDNSGNNAEEEYREAILDIPKILHETYLALCEYEFEPTI
jgi:adenosylhomocysteine nucleosidase